jgi:hypothetical protein
VFSTRRLELRDQPRIVHTCGDESMRRPGALQLLELLLGEHTFEAVDRERAVDRLLVEDEVTDLALLHEHLELAVGESLGVRREEHRLQEEEGDHRRHEVTDRKPLLFDFHRPHPRS